MNKLVKKIFLCVVMLSLGSLSFAGGPARHNHKGNFIAALTRAIEQQNLAARQAQTSSALKVVSQWERCDVLVPRRHGLWGSSMRVRKNWTCKKITTVCPVMKTDRAITIAAECYYPKKGKNQDITYLESYLLQGNVLKQKLKVLYQAAERVLFWVS